MKQLIPLLFILLFATSVYAQNDTNATTNSTTTLLPGISLSTIYSLLISVNPIMLLILGVALILVAKLAKFVGVVLIIIAVIHFVLLFLK